MVSGKGALGRIKDKFLQPWPKMEPIRKLIRPMLAEYVAMGTFVFFACGIGMTTSDFAAQNSNAQGITNLVIAFAFGFTIFLMVFATANISGGHVNIAVTTSVLVIRKISFLRAIFYGFAQTCGALTAVPLLIGLMPSSWQDQSCFAATTVNTASINVGQAFAIEVILAFLLLFVINSACDARFDQILAPFAIGMAVFIGHLLAVPLTGSAMNPTRSLASAVAAMYPDGCQKKGTIWEHHWIYWVGPIVGGIIACCVYEYVFHEAAYLDPAIVPSNKGAHEEHDRSDDEGDA